MKSPAAPVIGSLFWLVVAPGSVGGLIPWAISDWRLQPPFFGFARWVGSLLILMGVPVLLEAFTRFALYGRGTPAPYMPTERLVISGSYRHVRNPMYVAMVCTVLGQAFLFGQAPLVRPVPMGWLSRLRGGLRGAQPESSLWKAIRGILCGGPALVAQDTPVAWWRDHLKAQVGCETRQTVKTFVARTPRQWREWLERHHASESEVWLVFYKRHTGVASIAYEDAVDEALCFGWVDSLIKRVDGSRYARKFTPRRADSRWSPTNRKRYAALNASGRLKPAGLKRAPTDRSDGSPPRLASEIPPYIRVGLRARPAAWRHFEELAPSHRRRYLLWIDSAKQKETKIRRLKEAIRLLAGGKKLGLK